MTTLAQMFRDSFRRDLEWANGRLWTFPNIWVWVKNVPDEIRQQFESGKNRGYKAGECEMYELQPDGRVVTLTHGKSVVCPNVDLWPDLFPYPNKPDKPTTGRWVAMSACRKCEFYRSTKKTGLNYASCAWAKQERTKGKPARQVAQEEFLNSFSQAVKNVNELMK